MSKRERLVPRLTLREFVQKIGDEALYAGIAPTTRATYESNMRRWVLPLLGDTEVTELNARRVRRFAQQIEGDSTRGNALNLLSRICRHAMDLGYLQTNPVSISEVSRVSVRTQPRQILPTQAASDRLMDRIRLVSPRYADALTVTLECALRIGETAGLEVGDYDPTSHTLRIDRQVDGSGRVRPPKWGSVRTVPVTRTAHAVLIRYEEGREPGEPLFGSRGGRMSVSTMRKQLTWREVVAELGFPDLRIHDLRHTGCSRLARRLVGAGEPVTVIRDILGHRSISTTESYLHSVEEDMRRAAALLWE